MTWPTGAWPAARDAARDKQVATVVWVGDSLTAGSRCSDFRRRSMFGLVAAQLRARFGNGGDGFTPHATALPGGGVLTGSGTASSAFDATVPNGHVATLLAGGTLTWTLNDVVGSEIALYLRRGTGQAARWRIDEGPWQTVDCSGTGYVRAVASGLAAGAHQVQVEPTAGTIGIVGVEGRNDKGVRLHQMGLGGRTSRGNAFGTATGEDNATFRAATIGAWAPHLLVIALGVNDSNIGTPTTKANYLASLASMMTAARTARPGCDVVLIAHHVGAFDDTDYPDYCDALYELADTYGAVVVDIDRWARLDLTGAEAYPHYAEPPDGTSWGRWQQWGWWASFSTFGPSGTDPVHPGDTGHHVLAHVLTEVLSA